MTTVHKNLKGRKANDVPIRSFRCEDELWDRVKHEALRQRTSVQDICIAAINQYLKRRERRKAA